MKFLIFSTLFLLLGGCASEQAATSASETPESQRELKVVLNATETNSLSGKNICILSPGNFLKSESAADYPGLEAELEKILSARGFQLVKSPRKAHTILFVSLKKYRWVNDEWLYTTDLDKRDIKQVFFERLYLNTSIQAYGKRPIDGSVIHLAAVSHDWNELYPKFLSSLPSYLDSIGLKAPAADKAMKGDPGCVPRFGFDYAYKAVEDKQKTFVSNVLPNGPADKAGIKKGDEILSIDSMDWSKGFNFPELREVYEKSTPVPVKFMRGNRIYRGTLRSSIQCNNEESYK